MFTFGVKKVSPWYRPRWPLAWARLNLARASSEIAVAIWRISAGSNVAARPIACGKTVARPARATPCSASFHHS